ncbi:MULTISPECIES: GNAT family protein [unclassified Halomonas]|uniref:GNAT family N-acetyltransferase n=1 Tax=unclassified Halomonas TaxID=2609666 RepID=UPI0007D8F426|nr:MULTISPECIES: GNAT family protein [unclassified Halomonas]MBT2788396.1 GNAT family N-acetyltransferase [Halomonas sp. ISL-106]MBT2797987.1 GNAT family N-acetyltransferase [Halomonas sp. ISL-104]OAL60556.1 acetyltransferase [Halomonas sp. ALS9]
MIKLEKLNAADIAEVRNIAVRDDQLKFVGTAKEFLADSNEATHLHVIKHNDQAVGCFKIDIAYADGYDFCTEGSIGLRAFIIDAKQQGKGLGTLAVKALFPYLKENYANYPRIYLTVNTENPAAYTCYQKAGLHETGEQYLGGAAGPQHIMYWDIQRSNRRF